MAKREAQAHLLPALAGMPAQEELNLAGAGAPRQVPTGSAVERAEQALAERVAAFTDASEALRTEIRSFAAVIAEAEGRPAEPELRLVVSRETAEFEAIEPPEEAVTAPPASDADAGDGEELGKAVAASGDDRPSPAQIAEFFRIHEEREDSAPVQPAAAVTSPATPARARNPARERLYADIGGAIIGLAGASALINFVLLR